MTLLSPRAMWVVILAGSTLGSVGCASRGRVRTQQSEIDALKTQLAAVQREQSESRKQTESVRNELFILHDRLETARTMLARTQQAPPKLEVVKLSPGPSTDPLVARVKPVRIAPAPVAPDPLDAEGYDPSADEAEMFSYSGDDREAAARSDVALSAPGKPLAAPVKLAWRSSTSEASAVPREAASSSMAASGDPVPVLLAGTRTTGPKEDPMKMYQSAFQLFQAKNWNDAVLAFEGFVRANPTHEYADNAYYWMGECYYTQGEYALAVSEFQKIPELYPGGNKVPDALLKIGISYQGMSNRKNAEKTLRQLVDAYPQSDAAGIARQRLAKLQE